MKKIILSMAVMTLLAACSSSKQPLYHWDDAYSKSIYNHVNKSSDVNKEIQQLEKMEQKAYNKKKQLPPGFYAHLGLLYHDAGNTAKMQEYLQKEANLYEESKPYMNFLLKSKGGKK